MMIKKSKQKKRIKRLKNKKYSTWQQSRLPVLALVLLIFLVLTGCRSTAVLQPEPITIPALEVVRPPLVPEGLIEQPRTLAEVFNNGVVYEHAMYSWQNYAINGLEKQLDKVREALKGL